MRSPTLLLSTAAVKGLSKKPIAAPETSFTKQSKSPSDHPSGGVPETSSSGICGRDSWTRSKVSRPDGADLNLLSAMMMSGDGSVLQTTKASSGISVVMPRYSRSSTAFKTISDVGSSFKINTVFIDTPVRLEPDETVHAFGGDNLFALSSPDYVGIEVRSYSPCCLENGSPMPED